MPRKTKRQKIVSDYRKKLRELNASPVTFTVSSTVSKPAPVVKHEQKQPHTVKDIPEEKFETNRLQIVKDLRKTVLWSTVAICAEVVLYFVTTT
jgi:hypothetical protein